MFKKVYTANMVREGKMVGTVMARVWFFVSAYDAWDALIKLAADENASLCDFRRVK